MQDSGDARAKASGDTQNTGQRFGGPIGLSLFCALVLVAATLAVYWPALGGGFIWDDDVMLRNNPYVKSPSGLFDIWCSTRLPDFFPLTSTSFWLEWRLWGMRAAGYHLTNVLLHAASAVLLWRVLRRLAVPAAWLAALLFAVHPVNVESVAWITERKNTLSMVFYLLSLLCYLRFDNLTSTRNTQHAPSSLYALSLAAFLLALLAKTSVVMMPFVLLGCAWWQRGRIARRDLLRALPFFGLSLALGLVTIWFQYHRAIGGEVIQSGNFWARLAGAGWAVWFYLGKALFPWSLSFVYPRWEIDAHSLLSYLPTAAVVLSAGVLWRFRRTWGRAALFGLGYFVVMVFPVLGFVNIYFQRYSLVADHWQYYSIIGVIVLVVGAASRLSRAGFRSWPLRLAAGAVVMVLSVASWRQAGLYENPVVLWQDTLAKNPGCWMAHNNLGLFLANSADAGQSAPEEAMAHYKESLRLKPDQVEARINLGSALMKAGKLDDARAQFEAGAKASSSNGMVFYNLGLVLEEQGKPAEAQAMYRRAFEVWPDYAEPHNNLGAALQMQGNLPAAEAEFAEAVRLQPGLARAQNNLALSLLARGKTAEALDQLYQVLRLEPDYPEAHNNLGKALAEQGKVAEAKAEFAEAVRLKPAYADAQFNLGNTFLMMGKPSEAIPPYTAALQARPDFAEAHYQLGSILLNQGRADEAVPHFRAALQTRPDYPEAHYQLGTLFASRKQTADAILQFREAVRLKPDWLEALNNLAWLLATQPDERFRKPTEAIRLAAHAVELTRTNHPGPLDTLAAAYAAAGRFPEAIAAAQKAIDLATAAGQKPLAADIQKRRQAYQAGQPFRE